MTVQIEHVTITHKKQTLVDDVSIAIKEGDCLLLTGKGSSMLLECIAQLRKPQAGTILLDGKPLQRAQFAYASKDSYIANQETIDGYGIYLNHFYPDFSLSEYRRLIKQMKLDIHQRIRTLREAQRVLVELLGSYCCHTSFLLLNDPVSYLSKSQIENLKDLLRASSSTILLYAKHSAEWKDVANEIVAISSEESTEERESTAQTKDTETKAKPWKRHKQEETNTTASSKGRLFDEEDWDDETNW